METQIYIGEQILENHVYVAEEKNLKDTRLILCEFLYDRQRLQVRGPEVRLRGPGGMDSQGTRRIPTKDFFQIPP